MFNLLCLNYTCESIEYTYFMSPAPAPVDGPNTIVLPDPIPGRYPKKINIK